MDDLIKTGVRQLSIPPRREPVSWYENTVDVRGCQFSICDIKEFYEELSSINQKFGRDVITTLNRDPEMSDEEWEAYKTYLLQDAFCLTVSIKGEQDQQLYGESVDVFEHGALPNPIRTIYFNNVTAWARHASGTEPPNRLEVFLDFGKPPLLDPTSIVSEPTPNNSNVKVKADDMTFFRAVQQVIDTKILDRRTWYSGIHRSFTYDAGVWLIALPAGLIVATFYMEKWFPSGSNWEAYKWAFFLYAVGVVVLAYRFLSGYAKWAFPVNVLSDNKDRSLRHRLGLGAMLGWLFYRVADAVYGLLPFLN